MTTTISLNPATDIPDLSGKVILLTGGTAGLGKETILTLASHNPSQIFFTGRSTARANEIINSFTSSNSSSKTKLVFISCDLASFTSVKTAAQEFTAAASRLDLLFCNAGIMALPPGLTKDGYELQFGTNHMGHALLIKLLLPTILHTAKEPNSDVRIVSTTSEGFRFASGLPFAKLKTPNNMWMSGLGPWFRYGQSKLANILYAQELATRYPSIKAVSVHPGVINTGLISGLSWGHNMFVNVASYGKQVTVQEGVKNAVWAGTGPKEEVQNGQFYVPVGKVGPTTKASANKRLAKELWEWTQKEIDDWSL